MPRLSESRSGGQSAYRLAAGAPAQGAGSCQLPTPPPPLPSPTLCRPACLPLVVLPAACRGLRFAYWQHKQHSNMPELVLFKRRWHMASGASAAVPTFACSCLPLVQLCCLGPSHPRAALAKQNALSCIQYSQPCTPTLSHPALLACTCAAAASPADTLPVMMLLLCIVHVVWFIPYATGRMEQGASVWRHSNDCVAALTCRCGSCARLLTRELCSC